MVELSDFLGHLLKEITRARVQADMEAIKTAQMYAAEKNGLLKNFAIPRMRLPNVEITIPIAITDIPQGHVEKVEPNLLNQLVVHDLKELITKKEIKIDTAQITKIIEEDEFLSKGYLTATSIETFCTKMDNQIKATEPKIRTSQDTHKQVVSLIRKQLIKTFNKLPKKPLGIAINPNTSAIKEFNKSNTQGEANVMYLKMSITEEALEIDFKEPPQSDSNVQAKTKPLIKRLSPE